MLRLRVFRTFSKSTESIREREFLDLQSGIGRISIHLAKMGYEVVGTDISPLYLREAEKWAAKEKLKDKVRFYKLDSREATRKLWKNEKQFGAIINIGTSMGYFGEEADLHTFTDIRKVGGPKASLVIETVNRDSLVKNIQAVNMSTLEGIEWHETRKLNLETSTMENKWKFQEKRDLVATCFGRFGFTSRLFYP